MYSNVLSKILFTLKNLRQQTKKAEIAYRLPKTVTEVLCYKTPNGYTAYPICPTCKISFGREYQSYCDRCGQKLDWTQFSYDTCAKQFTPHTK